MLGNIVRRKWDLKFVALRRVFRRDIVEFNVVECELELQNAWEGSGYIFIS